jgi:hypothetical protein
VRLGMPPLCLVGRRTRGRGVRQRSDDAAVARWDVGRGHLRVGARTPLGMPCHQLADHGRIVLGRLGQLAFESLGGGELPEGCPSGLGERLEGLAALRELGLHLGELGHCGGSDGDGSADDVCGVAKDRQIALVAAKLFHEEVMVSSGGGQIGLDAADPIVQGAPGLLGRVDIGSSDSIDRGRRGWVLGASADRAFVTRVQAGRELGGHPVQAPLAKVEQPPGLSEGDPGGGQAGRLKARDGDRRAVEIVAESYQSPGLGR